MNEKRGAVADIGAAIAAVVLGTCIAYVDSRATWDDAGISAAALAIAAGLVSLARPSRWLPIGLVVGIPVVALNVMRFGRWDSIIAVAFSLIGSAIGGAIGRGMRRAVA
jgi:uncharacterized membrane protein